VQEGLSSKPTLLICFDLDRLGGWAEENAMKINPGKSKAVSFTSSSEGTTKVLSWRSKSSGSKQLQIFRNDHTQRFKLG
jgi:hypothetical protein